MKVKTSTSGLETTAAADGLVRKRAAPSCFWAELPASAKAEPACFACFFLPLTAALAGRLPAYMSSWLEFSSSDGNQLRSFAVWVKNYPSIILGQFNTRTNAIVLQKS